MPTGIESAPSRGDDRDIAVFSTYNSACLYTIRPQDWPTPWKFCEAQGLEAARSSKVLWEKTQAGIQLDFQYFRYFGAAHGHSLEYEWLPGLRSNSKLHYSQDDQPITKLSNTVKGDYKFGMEIPDIMISDAIKKLAGYKFNMVKKVESKNAKKFDEPEEQHVSPVKSGKGKWFMYYDGDDDAARYGVFMHNKYTATPNSTYLSPTVTSSFLYFIRTLLDETSANELTDFISHPVYTDAQTTSVVHNLEGNPELTSYILGENKKKRRKDVGKPSSRSSRQNNSLVIHAQVNTPAILSLDPKDEYIQTRQNPEWYTKSGSAGATKREEKSITSITKHYAARYYKQGIKDMISGRRSKETHRYIFEALNGIHHWEDNIIDFFNAEISTKIEGSVYSDLRIKSVIHVVVKKKWGYGFLTSIEVRISDDKEYEFSYTDLPRLGLNDVEDMYLLQVQDKLHHLQLEFVKDFNNALLLFIRRVMIQNRVEDIQQGVESYQQTLNRTKPIMFFEGMDQKIPFIMSRTHKGVVYLNQHNIKSFMKISEMKSSVMIHL
ncbi:hypothetical protein Tco_0967543 [Tanacetum coccineum]